MKSFHAASTAKTDTTPRIGRDIGSTMLQNSRKSLQPSTRAASMISRGQVVEEALDQRHVEGARAGRQEGAPEGVDQVRVRERHVQHRQVERHEQDHGRHEHRRQHQRRRAPGCPTAAGSTARSPPVTATTICVAQEPAAITTVFQKYSLRSMSTQAVRRFSQSMPFGHSAIGLRSVSWVGVIADFASHRIGPRATMTRRTSSAAVHQRCAASRRGRSAALEDRRDRRGTRRGRRGYGAAAGSASRPGSRAPAARPGSAG